MLQWQPGEFGDVRRIENPRDTEGREESMLFGDREGRTPKTEGGGAIVRAPLRVYIPLIFFLLIFAAPVRAESPKVRRVASAIEYPTAEEMVELLARACPRIVMTRGPLTTFRDLVRACDIQLEREDAPKRLCDPDLDGLCVH